MFWYPSACCGVVHSGERFALAGFSSYAPKVYFFLLPIASCLLPYLITLFPFASKSTGIVRPISFAAFKLITNSNFVACCTGKSAGLAPFKILST